MIEIKCPHCDGRGVVDDDEDFPAYLNKEFVNMVAEDWCFVFEQKQGKVDYWSTDCVSYGDEDDVDVVIVDINEYHTSHYIEDHTILRKYFITNQDARLKMMVDDRNIAKEEARKTKIIKLQDEQIILQKQNPQKRLDEIAMELNKLEWNR